MISPKGFMQKADTLVDGGTEMLIEPIQSTETRGIDPEVCKKFKAESGIKSEKREEEREQKLNPDQLREIATNLKDSINAIHNVDLQFSIHKSSGKLMTIVKDAGTDRVIREIPPSELLNLAAKMDEMIGILFDQQI